VAEALDTDTPEAPDEPETLDDELAAPVDFEPEKLPVAVAVAPLGALARAPAVIGTGIGERAVARSSKGLVSTKEKVETPSLLTDVILQIPEELSVIIHPITTVLEECKQWVQLRYMKETDEYVPFGRIRRSRVGSIGGITPIIGGGICKVSG
jgi:hypothetical protein